MTYGLRSVGKPQRSRYSVLRTSHRFLCFCGRSNLHPRSEYPLACRGGLRGERAAGDAVGLAIGSHRSCRAAHLAGNAWARTRTRRIPYSLGQTSSATLDLDATIERIMPGLRHLRLTGEEDWIRQEDIIVQYRPEPAVRLLVMLDTSLSMSGPYGTSAALIGSILAKHSPSGGLALVVFHSESKLLIRFGERLKPMEAAYRVLMSPLGGVTNIAGALRFCDRTGSFLG